MFELDAPNRKTSSSSSNAPSTGRCLSRKRLVTRTLEFPCVNWDWHGQQHSHIYCCADTVNHDLHWGPTQAVLKVTFDNTSQQVCTEECCAAWVSTAWTQLACEY